MGVFNILFKKERTKIGSIQVDVTISESHTAKSQVTKNPVEDGVDVADHVRLESLEYTMNGMITNTPSAFSLVDTGVGIVTSLTGQTNRALDAYNQIMELRESRQPFTLITGLIQYENMIIEEFVVNRDARTANAIFFTARMRQVEIATSETVSQSDSNLSTTVQNYGQNKKNLGTKSSEILGPEEPLSASPSGLSAETQQSWLKSLGDSLSSVTRAVTGGVV